jgi:hypothetical protein
MIAGRTYLERGLPVQVLCGWGPGNGNPDLTRRYFHTAPKQFGPRNVLIRRTNGETVIRGFRGLRKPKNGAAEPQPPRPTGGAA